MFPEQALGAPSLSRGLATLDPLLQQARLYLDFRLRLLPLQGFHLHNLLKRLCLPHLRAVHQLLQDLSLAPQHLHQLLLGPLFTL